MKILRKNDAFKKLPDGSINEVVSIKSYIEQGWKYCSKKEYKDFFKSGVSEKLEEKKIEKAENKEKKKEKKKNK
jgi:hypothetical protein